MKFEYLKIDDGDYVEEKDLNDLGEEGWELVAVVPYVYTNQSDFISTSFFSIFKRPLGE